ncbi:prolyl oligopeptidase [Diplogelasinospora grovesii]|uniref:Prolyl oligopeptidase n=1 Tax=Diplogelasinospora grovesii TaxID=303347 RepID=A0AAN6S2N7_9PEZI|nr:prolyl oligopeptidase [Diplogelasinospora grovesii]
MVITQQLTPKTFASLPRRGVILPSPDGIYGLYSVSTHGINGKRTEKEWRRLCLKSGLSRPLKCHEQTDDVAWLPPLGDYTRRLIWLRADPDRGVTQLLIVNDVIFPEHVYIASEFKGQVRHLKVRALEDGSVALAVVGQVGEDGGLYNAEAARKASAPKTYHDGMNVPELKHCAKPQRYGVFYTRLIWRDWSESEPDECSGWRAAGPLRNFCAKDISLEAPAGEDALGNFDISPKGIVFVGCRDLGDPAHTRAPDVYYVPIESWDAPVRYKPTKIIVQNDHDHYDNDNIGIVSNPRFSPDGTMIAYLKTSPPETADTRLMMAHVGSCVGFDVWKLVIGLPSSWELVPSSFEFAPTQHKRDSVFIIAEDRGRRSLYELELRHHARPRPLVKNVSVHAFYPIPSDAKDGNTRLLVSASSMVDYGLYMIVDTAEKPEQPRILSSATKNGVKLELSHSKQVSNIWLEGSSETTHAWVVKPGKFDDTKKWPVVLMLPEDAVRDEWNWKWNPALWAEQGSVIVCPSFTTPGERLHQDIINCMDYLPKLMPCIDLDRTVVAGGNVVTWMMLEHPLLAKKFRAIICDGRLLG